MPFSVRASAQTRKHILRSTPAATGGRSLETFTNSMKKGGIMVGAAMGVLVGWFVAKHLAHMAVLAGPYSDNYGAALAAVRDAKAKLQSGNTNVFAELTKVEDQITQAQQWTRKFLGEPDVAANQSQPVHRETNQPAAAAGSGR